MNKCILIGRMTKDIKKITTKNKKVVGTFTLAVPRDKENTDFINCICFEKTAELIEKYSQKGKRLAVLGRIQVSNYEDSDENKITRTDIIVNEIDILDFKESKKEEKTEEEEADLPF